MCYTNTKYFEEISKNNFDNLNTKLKELELIDNFLHKNNLLAISNNINIEPTSTDKLVQRVQFPINKNIVKNYRTQKYVKKIRKEIHHLKKHLRNYLNYYQYFFYNYSLNNDNIIVNNSKIHVEDHYNYSQFYEIDLNKVIDTIRKIDELKVKLNPLFERQIINYIFNEVDEISLRLQAYITIIYRNKPKINNGSISTVQTISEDNINYIVKQARYILNDKEDTQYNKFLAKKVLINYFSKDLNYYYTDTLLEININNIKELSNQENQESVESYNHTYGNDLIFINGLNVS